MTFFNKRSILKLDPVILSLMFMLSNCHCVVGTWIDESRRFIPSASEDVWAYASGNDGQVWEETQPSKSVWAVKIGIDAPNKLFLGWQHTLCYVLHEVN
jgi:hypothetical protein